MNEELIQKLAADAFPESVDRRARCAGALKKLASSLAQCNVTSDVEKGEVWRNGGDRIHVTEHGSMAILMGGHNIVMDIEKWHALGELRVALDKLIAP